MFFHLVRTVFCTAISVVNATMIDTSTNKPTITDKTVQETDTFTVIPMVSINWVALEGSFRGNRVAFLLGGGIGYNPVNTSVEFGLGPAFAWRSIQLSPMADIRRDVHLTNGFTPNESLGPTSMVTPTTANSWGVKAGITLSVRIPLGTAAPADK
jgi:hypothetical protein